jgi:hypothetical protein
MDLRTDSPYKTLLVSGALAPLALGATMIVHGGWRAALPAFAALAGLAFVVSLIRLLVIVERLAWAAPSAPRRRARLSSTPS